MLDINTLKGKKLLILAGADVHVKLVKAAKELGVYTIVTDYLEPKYSPAKQIADEYWMINIMDINAIVEKCKEECVSGVLAFCIDPAQIPYQRVCEKLGLPCYGTKELFETFTDKRKFKDLCKQYNVDVVPEYSLDDAEKGNVKYPILIKPTDSRGSRGIIVCESPENLKKCINYAKKESKTGEILIERYMLGLEDMGLAYIVIDSIPYLVKISDRLLGEVKDNLQFQQIVSILPSIHSDEFIEKVQPNIKNLIKATGMKFGAVFMQGFWENGHVYMYDPGLRFPGSDFDVITKNVTGFDSMKAFVVFALTGDITACFGNPVDAYNYNGGSCVIFAVSCRGGKIGRMKGLDVLKKNPIIHSVRQSYFEGDEVPESGDVRQRVVEMVAYLKDRNSFSDFARYVYNTLSIEDVDGSDMIVSRVSAKSESEPNMLNSVNGGGKFSLINNNRRLVLLNRIAA